MPDINSSTSFPYGTADLTPAPHRVAEKLRRVRCYVRGCDQILTVPTGRNPGQPCANHGIRCHDSSGGQTYSYADVARNIIVDAELVRKHIVGNPFKFDSHRLGLERSEDALTWNVFRSFQRAGLLHQLARRITGYDHDDEPQLYLWGLCLTDDSFRPWDLLVAARRRFETSLPVERPLTEPDIGLYLKGKYLILIEAKFTSPNMCYVDGPRRDGSSLTKNELLDIYQDRQLAILDIGRAQREPRVFYQLWRNVVFAEWMASTDERATAHVANLTRAGAGEDDCREFRRAMNPQFADHLSHATWEEIHDLTTESPQLAGLRRYLRTKTAGLRPAFQIR